MIRLRTAVCVTLLPLAAMAQDAKPAPLTARQVIERIQKNLGVTWHSQTVDTFKAGDPDTPVTGIAVTMMATYDVLVRAAAAGDNLIITHEPTFYGHTDQTGQLEHENDPVLAVKQDFIQKHHLVVWRFHDHWHMRTPDGIQTGMLRALGWEKFQTPTDIHILQMPETTVDQLASSIKQRIGIRAVRVVGDPAMRVTKVALSPGAGGFGSARHWLRRDDVEVLVIGEGVEWETVEYADDAIAEGRRKALIIMGHIPSEQAGMEDCAQWLKGIVTEVPVQFVAAKEPFWPAK